MLGIRQAPASTGYEKVLIDPFIPEDLEWAKGSFDSPNGRIEVAWVRKNVTVEVTVKAEKANIIVPSGRKNIQWKIHAGDEKEEETPSSAGILLPNPSFEEQKADAAHGRAAADTSRSPHVKLRSLPMEDVKWTTGIWADRFELCRKSMLPTLHSTLLILTTPVLQGFAAGPPTQTTQTDTSTPSARSRTICSSMAGTG
jgi:hypothetical protein